MSINIGPPSIDELRPRITVIGVGGAGGNAIANMIGAGIEGVDFVVVNTDAQALNNSIADTRIQLGPAITQGLGAGARPEVGRAAAEETLPDLERALDARLLRGAGIDVTRPEPPPAESVIMRLAQRNDVIVTPHTAWASRESQSRMGAQLCEVLESFAAGGKLNRLD